MNFLNANNSHAQQFVALCKKDLWDIFFRHWAKKLGYFFLEKGPKKLRYRNPGKGGQDMMEEPI